MRLQGKIMEIGKKKINKINKINKISKNRNGMKGLRTERLGTKSLTDLRKTDRKI